MARILLALLSCLIVASSGAFAQPLMLTTTFVGGNGQSGNMFDIVAKAPVTIQSFDIHLASGTTATIEIYYLTAGGSFVGNEANSSAWTLIGSAPGVVSAGANVATTVPITVGVTIPGSMAMPLTQGFYVTTTAGTLQYTNGVTPGAVFASDAYIDFLEGIGIAYPFGGTFNPRVWNGNIYYTLAGSSNAYQTNQAGASLDFDGVMGSSFAPAIVQKVPGSPTILHLSSTSTLGWELALTANTTTVPYPASGVITATGQVMNLDFTSPSLLFLNNLSFPPFVSASIPFAMPGGFTEVDAQMVVVDAVNPDGVSVSAASGLQPLSLLPSVPGPTGDDSSVTINLTSGQTAWLPSGLSFYGTTFTQMQVISNGRVMFGTANTTFSPSIAATLTDSPSVGYWCDLNPSTGGTITVSNPTPGIVRVDWAQVPYFGQATTATYGIQFDTNLGGIVTLDGLGGLQTGTSSAWLGISAGSLGATDPGATMFTAGSVGTGTAALDMIYAFGTQGSLAVGVNQIIFVPNGFGTYDWSVF